MRKHRNPRPNVPKPPSAHNPPRRPRPHLSHPALGNRRAADALRTILDVLAGVDRRRAMRFVEAVSALVATIRGRS